MSIFTEKLKNLQTSTNVLKKDICKAIGISIMAYYRYETGEREPTMKTLIALAKYFNVPIDFLLGNGLFEHYDFIIKNLNVFYKPFANIAFQVDSKKISFTDYLDSLNDIEKVTFLSTFVKNIEFKDNEAKIFWNF